MKKLENIEFIRIVEIAILFLLIFALTIVVDSYYGANIDSIIKFIIFVIIYIQIPGFSITKVLKVNYIKIWTKYIIAFYCGFALILIEYYILALINAPIIIKFINPIISIIFVLFSLSENRRSVKKIESSNKWYFIDLFFIFFIFVGFVLNLRLQYVTPEISKYVSVEQDFLFHMGNINSLARGEYPINNFKVDGILFFYHYFQDLLYGVFLKIFKIPADVIIYICSPYLLTYVFGGSILAFFKEFTKHKNRSGLYGAIFLVLNLLPMGIILGNIGNTGGRSWLNTHIFSDLNNVCSALSIILIIFISLKYCNRVSYVIITICIIGVATGIKGPMAAVVIASILVTAIIGLFKNRKAIDKYKLVLLVGSSAIFLIVYLFIISGVQKGSSPKGVNLSFSIIETVQYSPLYQMFVGEIENGTVIFYLLICFAILCEMVLITGALAVPYLIYLFSEGRKIFFRKKYFSWIETINYFIILIGIGGFLIVGQEGKSQVYFLFTALPFMYLTVIRMIENINSYKSIKKYIIIPWCIIGLIVGMFFFYNNLDRTFDTAYSKLVSAKIEAPDSYGIMLRDEYEGWVWIRNNTDTDAVIATDRRNLSSSKQFEIIDGSYFYGSAYSQRQMYCEGTNYSGISDDEIQEKMDILKQIYDENNSERAEIALKKGIDYVVVTETVNPNFDLSNEKMRLCYENSAIKIYKVIE